MKVLVLGLAAVAGLASAQSFPASFPVSGTVTHSTVSSASASITGSVPPSAPAKPTGKPNWEDVCYEDDETQDDCDDDDDNGSWNEWYQWNPVPSPHPTSSYAVQPPIDSAKPTGKPEMEDTCYEDDDAEDDCDEDEGNDADGSSNDWHEWNTASELRPTSSYPVHTPSESPKPTHEPGWEDVCYEDDCNDTGDESWNDWHEWDTTSAVYQTSSSTFNSPSTGPSSTYPGQPLPDSTTSAPNSTAYPTTHPAVTTSTIPAPIQTPPSSAATTTTRTTTTTTTTTGIVPTFTGAASDRRVAPIGLLAVPAVAMLLV